jgi:hypothetical protein
MLTALRNLTIVLLLLTLSAAPARASDAMTPYRLRIVLDVERHRLLTDVFSAQVERELGDGLRAALGDLAKVEVVREHPRLADVQRRGLERSLDEWKQRSGIKTHFVLLRYVGGRYEIQARQHDGLTGTPSPVVRRQRIRDRAFVARAAALLVEHDFGLVGTITTAPDASRNVTVQFRGGGLGPLVGWARAGDIFALVQVPAGNAAGQVIPWSYVQLENAPRGGTATARLLTRYKLTRVAGLRCVRLGTTKGPLRLRLVKDASGGDRGVRVKLEFRQSGFEGPARFPLDADNTRDVDTSTYDNGRFEHLAYVTILDGTTVLARVPVPILDDRLIVLPVPAPKSDDNLLAFRVAALRRDVADSYLDQTNLFRELNRLSAKAESRAAAIERARTGLKRTSEDHERLSTERGDLSKEEKNLSPRDRAVLGQITEGLRQIKKGEEELRAHLKELEKIDREERDPTRKDYLEKVQQARLLEKRAEIEEAKALLEKLVTSPHATAELKKDLERVKKLAQPKSPEHEKARRYIYRTFPKLDTLALKDGLKEARNAFDVCRKVGDTIGPLRLRTALRTHHGRITVEAAALKPEINIDDEKPARMIAELLPVMRKLDTDITAYLDAAPGGG